MTTSSGPLSLTFAGPGMWNGGPQGGAFDPQPLGSFTGTPQSIVGDVNNIFAHTDGQPLQNKLQDVLTDAQHYGVSMDRLAGAYGMNADQGAMALYDHGVDPSRIYTPSYQGNFSAADQTQNAPTAAGSPTLSSGGIANFQDYINQQLSGGYDTSGQYTGPTDMFAGGKFNPTAASGGLPQEELLQKIAAAGEALGMTPEQQAAGLGGTYTPAQIQAYESDPNNKTAIGIDQSIFNTDEMFSRDPGAAPNYAAIYSPTRTFASGGSVPSWAQDMQNFGDLSNLPPELWAQIQGYTPRDTTGAGGPNYVPGGGWTYGDYTIVPDVSSGTGENNIGNDTLNGFNVTHNGNQGQGELYGHYDPSGAYQGMQAINGHQDWADFIGMVGAAIGINAIGSAAGAGAGMAGDATAAGYDPLYGASTGSGGFAGDATAAGYGGLDAASTTSMGGGASINGGAALGTGAGASAADGAFNAARDSQLANEQLGLGPVTDMTPPAIPVNGPTGVTPGSGLTPPPSPGPGPSSGPAPGPGGLNLSNSDWLKLIAGLGSLTGGGGSPPSSPAPAPAPSVDANYSYSVPGWRSDRPMYVPGQDAIPEGWFGAGHTS